MLGQASLTMPERAPITAAAAAPVAAAAAAAPMTSLEAMPNLSTSQEVKQTPPNSLATVYPQLARLNTLSSPSIVAAHCPRARLNTLSPPPLIAAHCPRESLRTMPPEILQMILAFTQVPLTNLNKYFNEYTEFKVTKLSIEPTDQKAGFVIVNNKRDVDAKAGYFNVLYLTITPRSVAFLDHVQTNTKLNGVVLDADDKFIDNITANRIRSALITLSMHGLRRVHIKNATFTYRILKTMHVKTETTYENCKSLSHSDLPTSTTTRLRLVNTKFEGHIIVPLYVRHFICRKTYYTEATLRSICECVQLQHLEIDYSRGLPKYLPLFPQTLISITIYVRSKLKYKFNWAMERLANQSAAFQTVKDKLIIKRL